MGKFCVYNYSYPPSLEKGKWGFEDKLFQNVTMESSLSIKNKRKSKMPVSRSRSTKHNSQSNKLPARDKKERPVNTKVEKERRRRRNDSLHSDRSGKKTGR